MPEQTYQTHRRYVFPYHVVLLAFVVAGLIGSCVNLWRSFGDPSRHYNAALLVLVFVCLFLVGAFARSFPLKAQDRAIRAEESLRHYILTGRPLDPRLSVRQIVGLRFASDEELAALAARAAEEGLSEDAIKRAVKNWRPDEYRV